MDWISATYDSVTLCILFQRFLIQCHEHRFISSESLFGKQFCSTASLVFFYYCKIWLTGPLHHLLEISKLLGLISFFTLANDWAWSLFLTLFKRSEIQWFCFNYWGQARKTIQWLFCGCWMWISDSESFFIQIIRLSIMLYLWILKAIQFII